MAETQPSANCFVGFHDIIPWSPDDSVVAIHRAAPGFFRLEDCSKPIDICLWRPQSEEIDVIESTTAWNFQQGARLQWLPGSKSTLAFNAVQAGQAISVFRDVQTGTRRTLPAPIYVFSPDGAISISPNFTTLAHLWRAYGYPVLAGNPLITDPDADGLWQLDIRTGEQKLFISLRRAVEFEAGKNIEPDGHFLCHVSFSPDGTRVAFLERYFSADHALVTRMLVTDPEAKTLKVLANGGVSHFDWLDNDKIVVWTRPSGALAAMRSSGALGSPILRPLLKLGRSFKGKWKKKLLSEAYYVISVDNPGTKYRFGWPSLSFDGHPMVARSHRWIVTDYYPNAKNELPVILYNADRQIRADAHVFVHHPRSVDTDVKCDLHPRWNRKEDKVAVDTCEAGYRQVRILDVSDIVRA